MAVAFAALAALSIVANPARANDTAPIMAKMGDVLPEECARIEANAGPNARRDVPSGILFQCLGAERQALEGIEGMLAVAATRLVARISCAPSAQPTACAL